MWESARCRNAADFGDEGSNTLAAAATSSYFSMPNMKKLGLFNIEGVTCGEKEADPAGAVARMTEVSKGKDTTIGHWEIAGVISPKPLPTFPEGFPRELLDEFEKETGRKVICNKPYSGTEVIKDYGREHVETGALIVYTSADSVFQDSLPMRMWFPLKNCIVTVRLPAACVQADMELDVSSPVRLRGNGLIRERPAATIIPWFPQRKPCWMQSALPDRRYWQ